MKNENDTPIINIRDIVLNNNSYRRVIKTGKYSQIVIMSLKPNEDIPMEIHNNIDQIIYIVKGNAKIIISKTEYNLINDMMIMIKAGKHHYVKNNSSNKPLKLYTIYSPTEHKYNLEQKNKPKNI
jgi:mannose-6-phosphate isomerase-like protein (cupin superfamily)